jgi:hypothetical protein
MRKTAPMWAGDRSVAVLVEPSKDFRALEHAAALSAATGSKLIILVPRPRLLRGLIRLAGHDPDELAHHASAARKSEVHRLVEGVEPGLPHLVLEVDRLHLRDSVRLAESYRCSTFVLPRRASFRARFAGHLKVSAAGFEVVVAP